MPLPQDFFDKIGVGLPYAKVGAQGLEGSGKTYTLARVTAGLHKHLGLDTPVMIFDTEESSKFLVPLFRKAKIDVLVKRSHTLSDLKRTMQLAEENGSILFIDSITHVSNRITRDHLKKKGRSFLTMKDFGYLHPMWNEQFSQPFVHLKAHCLFTGRQGFRYSMEPDEDGNKQLETVGTKMKAPSETGYEPDLLLSMARCEDFQLVKGKQKLTVWREATVLKDRSGLIEGQVFKNPTWEDFKPHVDFLMSVAAKPMEDETPNDGLLQSEDDRRAYAKERDKWVERFFVLLDAAAPNTNSQKAKKLRMELKDKALGETSDLAIGQMPVEYLESGTAKLKELVAEMESAATDAA